MQNKLLQLQTGAPEGCGCRRSTAAPGAAGWWLELDSPLLGVGCRQRRTVISDFRMPARMKLFKAARQGQRKGSRPVAHDSQPTRFKPLPSLLIRRKWSLRLARLRRGLHVRHAVCSRALRPPSLGNEPYEPLNHSTMPRRGVHRTGHGMNTQLLGGGSAHSGGWVGSAKKIPIEALSSLCANRSC